MDFTPAARRRTPKSTGRSDPSWSAPRGVEGPRQINGLAGMRGGVSILELSSLPGVVLLT
jgi:hypothetical protein